MPLTIRRRLVDRVRQWRKIAYAVSAAFVLLAAGVVFLSISAPSSTTEIATGPTFFDPGRSFRSAEDMHQYYPERALGSADAKGVVNWLLEKLPNPEVAQVDTFVVRLGDKDVTLRNVAVVLEGTSREAILVAAPRDTPPVVKVEPLSYATGTAILLELIQVFTARPHEKTLVFLSTEDGSTGGLGIDRFLETSEVADNVSVILSLQGLGKERSESLAAGVTGAQNTTPGWYLELVTNLFGQVGLDLNVPSLLSQAADHALALSKGDQVAGLSRGIPALRLYDDGPGNPTAEGLATQGAVIERLLLSLDTGTQIPSNPGTALLLKSGRYFTERAVTLLAVLMLLPSFAALLIWLFSSRMTWHTVLYHLRNLLSFCLPLLVILGAAYIFGRTGLIPMYRFQVPTSPGASTQPRLAPTLILFLLWLATFIVSRRFLGYFRPREGRATAEMARLFTGNLSLLLALVLAVTHSPFLVLPGLAAAWVWPLATCFAEPVYGGALWRHRLTTNAPVLLFGLSMPLLLYGYLAESTGIGWLRSWWFLTVQTVSGSFGISGPLAAVFFLSALAELAGVKRMRVVPIETLEAPDEFSLLEPPVPRSRRRPRTATRPPLSPWR